MMDNMFSSIDFGPVQELLDNDDVTDISYSNGGQCWLKTLSKGIYRIENPAINNAFMEKLASASSMTTVLTLSSLTSHLIWLILS